MWFIKYQDQYMSVRDFPTITNVESNQRNMTEVFKVSRCDQGLLLCSCSNPSVYLGKDCVLSLNPFDAFAFPSMEAIQAGSCMEEIYVGVTNITKCSQDIDNFGYTIIEDMFDSSIIDTIKEALQLNTHAAHDSKQIRHSDLIQKVPNASYNLLSLAPVQMLLKCYMKDSFKLSTWSSNTLLKHKQATNDLAWHVDYPFHDIQPPWLQGPLASPLSLQTLYVIDDFTEMNGGTWIIPKSHLNQTFPNPNNIDTSLAKQLVCKKGSVVVSHGACWHSQGCNFTDTPRTCLLGTFTTKWIKSKDDMSDQLKDLPDNLKNEFKAIIN